jgi:ketosteroid isomerase-like protein
MVDGRAPSGAPDFEEHRMDGNGSVDVLEAVIAAVNRHDLDGLVACFAEDVRSTTPAHPARSFVGRDQVRRNWAQIFGAIRDIEAEVLSSATSGDRVWAELRFQGHTPDGAPWQLRGVTINEVRTGRVAALEFYMEPVDLDAAGPDSSVRRIVNGGAPVGAAAIGGPR